MEWDDPTSDPTWEPLANVRHLVVVRDYLDAQASRLATDSPTRPRAVGAEYHDTQCEESG